jgi:prepilin-type N-terminal cleavage/methylation domain-containing protein
MWRQRGFSLIELLIVVAIILIIAAIAIPNLLRSRIAANEASAVGSLRTYNVAQITYVSTYPTVGFAAAFSALGPPASGGVSSASAGLIDNVLGSGGTATSKSGYKFSLATTPAGTVNVGYSINANPISSGATGNRYFYTDNSAVIRVNLTAAAGSADSPLQ